jgi:hypothetical protein
LVTRVLPRAPFRQWVFTVPKPLRLRLDAPSGVARWAGQLVVRAIGVWQRRVARARGLAAPRTGPWCSGFIAALYSTSSGVPSCSG